MATGVFVAHHNHAVAKARVMQGAGDGLGHPAAAAQGKGQPRVHLMLGNQTLHGNIIRVIGCQMAVGVDDRIDRFDGLHRGIQLS